jgi:hypothetical protein
VNAGPAALQAFFFAKPKYGQVQKIWRAIDLVLFSFHTKTLHPITSDV